MKSFPDKNVENEFTKTLKIREHTDNGGKVSSGYSTTVPVATYMCRTFQ